MSRQDHAKRLAGVRAADEFVHNGMRLGLGSGTTSHFFVRELGARVRAGLSIVAAATSRNTEAVAHEAGIKLTGINEIGRIDLTVDGPDEIDQGLRMIKGGGACLLWEKIVAHASRRMITICDETKIVKVLGGFPLPVEVVQFGHAQTKLRIAETLARADVGSVEVLRRERNGAAVLTDSGNFIFDCACRRIGDPAALEAALNLIPGVVENGLFTREADGMVIGRFDGTSAVVMREQAF